MTTDTIKRAVRFKVPPGYSLGRHRRRYVFTVRGEMHPRRVVDGVEVIGLANPDECVRAMWAHAGLPAPDPLFADLTAMLTVSPTGDT